MQLMCLLDGHTAATKYVEDPPITLHAWSSYIAVDLSCNAGVRQDNLAVEREGSRQKRGYRFFADDEDMYALEDLLQALCFLETGRTWVPAKPWEANIFGAQISERNLLPAAVQKMLDNLKKEEE